MRNRIFRLGFGLLLALVASRVVASDWVTLERCRWEKHRANDGDSFMVRVRGEEYLFRLYFVDTPETDDDFPDRVRSQADHFGGSMEAMLEAGEQAKQFSERFLRHGFFKVYTCWEDARGSGISKRFYAIVEKDGQTLQEALAKAGLARVYGKWAPDRWGSQSPADFRARLLRLERAARQKGEGAWPRPGGKTSKGESASRAVDTGPGAHSAVAVNIRTASVFGVENIPGVGPPLASSFCRPARGGVSIGP